MDTGLAFGRYIALVVVVGVVVSMIRKRLPSALAFKGSRFSTKTDLLAIQLQPFRQYFPHLSAEQWNNLEKFCELTSEWNEKINLISRKDIGEIIPRHLLPSMSIAIVKKFNLNENIVDIGCGGGFPGLPLAIMFPDSHFTLLDSSSKKMMVVEEVATKLRLSNVRVITSRAEKCQETFDTLLGRAVSAIPNFLTFSCHLQRNSSSSTGLWYIKGGEFQNELKDSKLSRFSLYPIKDHLPVDTDKSILHIPAEEIISFRKRLIISYHRNLNCK